MAHSKSSFMISCYALLLCCFLMSCSATRFVNIGETTAASSQADVAFQAADHQKINLGSLTHGRNLLWGWSHWWPSQWFNHHYATPYDTPTGSVVDNDITGTLPEADYDNVEFPGFESPATEPGSDLGLDVIEGGDDDVGGRAIVCGVTVQNVGTYYRGVRLSAPTNSGSATRCCRRCRQTSGCDYWAFCDKDSGCETAGPNSARLLKGQCELKKKEPEVLARGAGVDVISGRNAASGGNRVTQTETEVIFERQTEGETTEELIGVQADDEQGALFADFEITDNNINDNQRADAGADGDGPVVVEFETFEEVLDANP